MKMAVFWVVAIALMMEAAWTSETLVNSHKSTRRYNPEDSHLQILGTFKDLNDYQLLRNDLAPWS
jgi:hypothetical protein